MIVARFYEKGEFLESFNATDLTISRELNAVDTFDFSINVSSMRGSFLDHNRRMTVAITDTGEEKIFGYLHQLTLQSVGKYSVKCNGLMHELTKIRAKSNAKYQNQQVIAILLDLLTYAPGWRLGSIVTMEDPLVQTTIDLRGEKRLFAQIMKLVESVPNLFLRQGDGRTIDLGIFNRETLPFIPPSSITDFQIDHNHSEVTYQMEAYGGSVTIVTPSPTEGEPDIRRQRTVTLADALAYNPQLEFHSNFPIKLDRGTHVVRNVRDNVQDGVETLEVFNDIVPPERENPPEASMREAGYALWLKSVKELINRSTDGETLSCSTRFLPPGFRLGDQVYIHAAAAQVYFDPMSGGVTYRDVGAVSGWFRVFSYDESFDEEGKSYSLRMTKDLVFRRDHPLLQLYEAAANEVDPTFSENAVELNRFEVLSVLVPAGLPPDCFNLDGDEVFNGRLVQLDLPTRPAGVTRVELYGQPFANNPLATVRLVTAPVYSNDPSVANVPVEACVSLNRDWTTTSSVRVYALVQYRKD